LLYRIFQDRVANLFCGLIFVVAHDLLDLKTALLIAAVVSTIRVKEKNIPSVHLRQLFYVRREERLYAKGELTDGDRDRLAKIKVELDQCWDLLRQRRALREFGRDPDQAKVRPPKVVENYEQ